MKQFDADYYDKDYYEFGSDKNSYAAPYDWESEGEGMLLLAGRIQQLFQPKTVLEVGCALGFLLKALHLHGIDAYGCDISHYAVEEASKLFPGKVRQVDVRDGLPYSTDCFDVVVSTAVLEHVDAPYIGKTANGLLRVSKQWVYVSVPISLGHLNAPWGDPSHVTYMPAHWWIEHFCPPAVLDMRRSRQVGFHPYHDVELAFCKGRLPDE